MLPAGCSGHADLCAVITCYVRDAPLAAPLRHRTHFTAARARRYRTGSLSVRPEPAERSAGEGAVDEPIERRFGGETPGAAVPDGKLAECEGVTDKGGCPDDLENAQVRGARSECATGDVRTEDAHHDEEHEPLQEIPPHRHHAVRHDRHHRHRPL